MSAAKKKEGNSGSGAGKDGKDGKKVTINGIVAPWDWDANDDVIAVAITTNDDKDFVIRSKAAIRQLMRHMDEKVEASGAVEPSDSGELLFTMADFEVIDDGQEWAEEENWEAEEDWGDEEED